ncbi:MAG: PAS domain S-box protein [Spirochaetes bacterium]|nr:PAS domain S-box protein [Spirochaetota bacterium]
MVKIKSKDSPDSTKGRLKELSTFYNLYRATCSTLNLNELLNVIMEMTLNMIKAEVGLIFLYNKRTKEKSGYVPWGLGKEILEKIYYKKKTNLIDWLQSRDKALLIRDFDRDKDFYYSLEKRIFIKSLLYAPLITKTKRIGGIILANKSHYDKIINFTQEDLNIFQTISGQISVAIENSQLYEQVVDIKNYNLGIVNSINIGVITTSFDKRIITVNKVAEFIFNIRERDMTGRPVAVLFKNIEKKKKHVILQALDRNENLINFESDVNLSDGEKRILSISTSNLKGGEDTIIGYVISVQDISEKNRLEEQIQRSEQLTALGQLSAGIAHEIKNPLTSIKGFTQLLPDKLNDKEFLVKYSQVIRREVDRLNNIIEELLQFARPRVKGFEQFNLIRILDKALALLRFQLDKNSIELNLVLKDLPDVYGDPRQMEQVFINLILNAVQAMPAGGELEIKSQVAIKKSPQNLYYEYAEMSFHDTGHGLDGQALKKMFNPFFTTKNKGTGLGLSISHRIVTEHKGFIQVHSEPEKGATFIISIPTMSNF